MFDPRTSHLLRSAPGLPGLDSEQLPQILTRHFTELVSARLRLADGDAGNVEQLWPLDRIADAYEIIASIANDPDLRRASSFVAGTAQQIISRKSLLIEEEISKPFLTRDGVDESMAAAILFLCAEQYADANEAASMILPREGPLELMVLGAHIRDLARGRLERILKRASTRLRREKLRGPIQYRALLTIASALSEGIVLLAESILSVTPSEIPKRFSSAQHAFDRVKKISIIGHGERSELGGPFITRYAGPFHLASLLELAAGSLEAASVTKIPPPRGANDDFWIKWLRFRAKDMPYVWPNHREAVADHFYETGRSAVLVLPTGAGKTTISALKIAGTLARNKQVVFLAPTHALVEQLTEDLQNIFPEDQFGLEVSSDFDALLIDNNQFQDIEIMTPERCLTLLSFSPDSFKNVGLLVFDECHLLSPQSGKIGRALDGMFCLLTFSMIVKDADMLFLSAMLKESDQFAAWIRYLTNRQCSSVDLLWKPSRQARGVVVYEEAELKSSIRRAGSRQREQDREKGKQATSLRSKAKKELTAIPHVVWGLQHNWLSSNDSYVFTRISDKKVHLNGNIQRKEISVLPNANKVASEIALSAASGHLKTIIFVNTKSHSITTAHDISKQLDTVVALKDSEINLWNAIIDELGDAKHSIFEESSFNAVPHNAGMLRLERQLSEKLFRRSDGAKVIVATPTLAQGLNLPAHIAILAGDKRMSNIHHNRRENLEAHELLNAAARAGRAGHLANGVVILIPEPIVSYKAQESLSREIKQKLSSVMPEDDRCVVINDPLEIVLDRIMAGDINDHDVRYTINRLTTLDAMDTQDNSRETLITRSLSGFAARSRLEEKAYAEKIETLWSIVHKTALEKPELTVVSLSSQSGLPIPLLERLRKRLLKSAGALPTAIEDWLSWTIAWLCSDAEALDHIFRDVHKSALRAVGRSIEDKLNESALMILLPGIIGWVSGKPISGIETDLGGSPNSIKETLRICPRARELISNVIPRGICFIVGIISRMVEELDLFSCQPELSRPTVQSLATATRKGFNSVAKVEYANRHKEILSRVQVHRRFERIHGSAH